PISVPTGSLTWRGAAQSGAQAGPRRILWPRPGGHGPDGNRFGQEGRGQLLACCLGGCHDRLRDRRHHPPGGLKAPIDAGNPGSSRRANTTRNQSSLSFVKVMTASASFYGTCGMMDSATFGGRDEIPVWVSGSAEPVRGDADRKSV